jgi:protein phosphatase-4 regulatory subunit 3
MADTKSSQGDPWLYAHSEDVPDRTLLEERIYGDYSYYQKQTGTNMQSMVNPRKKSVINNLADTLIVWMERDGTDMALSFQEPEGCAAIWYSNRLFRYKRSV